MPSLVGGSSLRKLPQVAPSFAPFSFTCPFPFIPFSYLDHVAFSFSYLDHVSRLPAGLEASGLSFLQSSARTVFEKPQLITWRVKSRLVGVHVSCSMTWFLVTFPLVSFYSSPFSISHGAPAISAVFTEPQNTMALHTSMPLHILQCVSRICPGYLLLRNKHPKT